MLLVNCAGLISESRAGHRLLDIELAQYRQQCRNSPLCIRFCSACHPVTHTPALCISTIFVLNVALQAQPQPLRRFGGASLHRNTIFLRLPWSCGGRRRGAQRYARHAAQGQSRAHHINLARSLLQSLQVSVPCTSPSTLEAVAQALKLVSAP